MLFGRKPKTLQQQFDEMPPYKIGQLRVIRAWDIHKAQNYYKLQKFDYTFEYDGTPGGARNGKPDWQTIAKGDWVWAKRTMTHFKITEEDIAE